MLNALKSIQLLGSYISFELDTSGNIHLVLTEDYCDMFNADEKEEHKAAFAQIDALLDTLNKGK